MCLIEHGTWCFVNGYRRDGRNLQPFHSRRVSTSWMPARRCGLLAELTGALPSSRINSICRDAMRWFHSGGGSLPNHAYIDSASNGSRYCKYHAGQCASSTTSSTSSCSSDPARLQQHVSRRGNTSFATSYTTPCGHTCTIAVTRVKFRR